MVQRLYILLFFVCIGTSIFAQKPGHYNDKDTRSPRENEKEPAVDSAAKSMSFWRKAFIGGGLGLQFGNITDVYIAPDFGYWLTPKFHAGIGLTYRYYNNELTQFSTHVFGGSVFARFFFFKDFFAHSNYEFLHAKWYSNEDPFTISQLFLGGGYAYRFGPNRATFFAIMALWNVLPSDQYRNTGIPQIRMSFGIGL